MAPADGLEPRTQRHQRILQAGRSTTRGESSNQREHTTIPTIPITENSTYVRIFNIPTVSLSSKKTRGQNIKSEQFEPPNDRSTYEICMFETFFRETLYFFPLIVFFLLVLKGSCVSSLPHSPALFLHCIPTNTQTTHAYKIRISLIVGEQVPPISARLAAHDGHLRVPRRPPTEIKQL